MDRQVRACEGRARALSQVDPGLPEELSIGRRRQEASPVPQGPGTGNPFSGNGSTGLTMTGSTVPRE